MTRDGTPKAAGPRAAARTKDARPPAAARVRAAVPEEVRSILARMRRHWQGIRTLQGQWQDPPDPARAVPARTVRFAYHSPGRFREESDGEDPGRPELTVCDGATVFQFWLRRWLVEQSLPGREPLSDYTPGAADPDALVARYPQVSLVPGAGAPPGVRVLGFSDATDPVDGPGVWGADRVQLWVDAATGSIRRYLMFSRFGDGTPGEERVYEDWVVAGGVPLAQRLRRRRSGVYRDWADRVYTGLRLNRPTAAARFRFEPPKGAAVLPKLPRFSILGARRYVEEHPDDAGGHAYYGELLTMNAQAGEPRRARGQSELRKALELAPDVGYYQAAYAGDLRNGRRDPDDAAIERHLRAAVAACPRASGFRRQLVEFLVQRGRLDEAGAARGDDESRSGGRSDYSYTDGLRVAALIRQGKWDEALELAHTAYERQGSTFELSQFFRQVPSDAAPMAKAQAELRRLLHDPALPDDRFASLWSALRMAVPGHGSSTLGLWLEALGARPRVAVPWAFLHLSDADRTPLLPDMARFLVDEIRRRPDARLKLWLAQVYRESGKREDAVRLLTEATREADDWDLLSECARTWQALGNAEAAVEATKEYLRRHPEDERARRAMFHSLADTRRYQDALEVYGEPVKARGNPPRRSIGLPGDEKLLRCYQELGRMGELADRLRREAEREPRSFLLRLVLGDVQSQAGEAEAANKTWLALAGRPGLSRWQRLNLASRLEQAGALDAARGLLERAAREPVTREELAQQMHSAVLPEEWDQLQCQAALLRRLGRIRERLGDAAGALAAQQRIEALRAELGMEEYAIGKPPGGL